MTDSLAVYWRDDKALGPFSVKSGLRAAVECLSQCHLDNCRSPREKRGVPSQKQQTYFLAFLGGDV